VAKKAEGDRVVSRISKSGQRKSLKTKVRATGFNHLLNIQHRNRSLQMMWDTGASFTTMRPAQARHLQILDSNDRIVAGSGITEGAAQQMLTANGRVNMRRLNNVPLTVRRTNETVRGPVTLSSGLAGAPLLGLGHIKKVKLYKVKFRSPPAGGGGGGGGGGSSSSS
jgi:predicted aspartyl protease